MKWVLDACMKRQKELDDGYRERIAELEALNHKPAA